MTVSTSLAAESLGTGVQVRTYDPSSADVDFVAVGGSATRWITVVDSAGTIVVTDLTDTDVELPAMPQGYVHVGAFKAMKATSVCSSVIVTW